MSSYRIPSIIEIPSSFAPTSEEFYTIHNNRLHSCAPSKESSSITADTHNLDIDVSSFEQHAIAASSYLESANSEDCEVKLSIAKDGELQMDVSCGTLELMKPIATNLNDMSTSSFVEDLIVTSSNKLNTKCR